MLEVDKEYSGYTVRSFYRQGNNRMVKTTHSCGVERSFSIYALEKGQINNCKECGGARTEFPVGFRSQDGWEIISHGEWGGRSLFLEAQHDCGQVRKFTSFHFRNNTQECQKCIARVAFRKPLKTLAISNKLSAYKHSARQRNYEFALSDNEFEKLIFDKCRYCGRGPQSEFKPPRNLSQKWRDEKVFVNGIDRVDNDRGYIIDNCVSCCWKCNKIKGSMPLNEWSMMVDLWADAKAAW